MPEELDKPGVDNNQLEDCDRVSEFERIIYRQGSARTSAISYRFSYLNPFNFTINILCILVGNQSRFNIESKEWSHKASIANNAVIGTMNQDRNVKSLALRHDVDCCVWNTEEMNPKCPMNHIATFDGVGYIHG